MAEERKKLWSKRKQPVAAMEELAVEIAVDHTIQRVDADFTGAAIADGGVSQVGGAVDAFERFQYGKPGGILYQYDVEHAIIKLCFRRDSHTVAKRRAVGTGDQQRASGVKFITIKTNVNIRRRGAQDRGNGSGEIRPRTLDQRGIHTAADVTADATAGDIEVTAPDIRAIAIRELYDADIAAWDEPLQPFDVFEEPFGCTRRGEIQPVPMETCHTREWADFGCDRSG